MFFDFPSWLGPILASALLLGFYDIAKKAAVRDNPILPVLLLSSCCGTAFFIFAMILSGGMADSFRCTGHVWRLIMLKSLLVASSWACVYYAMRELPISMVSPIRASAPLWTFIGGLLIFGEVPTWTQALGMLAVFAGYYMFSAAGKFEGIDWRNNRGLHFLILGTLLGAASALYDKYLLNFLGLDRTTVQLHFSLDLVSIYFAAWAIDRLSGRRESRRFQWRWSIAATGILLILADYLYFDAVSSPEARISIISLLRRCSCVVSFAFGVVYFRETNIRRKAIALAAILFGVLLLLLKV